MELEEIVLVLTNCFDRDELDSLLGAHAAGDPYKVAARMILEGDPLGDDICERLDQNSQPQREQVHSMTLPGLRSSLTPASIQLMGPGPHLGGLLWALLRDGRVGAAHIAHEIAQAKSGGAPPDTGVDPLARPAPTPAPAEAVEDTDLSLEDIDLGLDSIDLSGSGESTLEGFEDVLGEDESAGGAVELEEDEDDLSGVPDLDLDLDDDLAEPAAIQASPADDDLTDIEIPDLSADLSDLDDLLDEDMTAEESATGFEETGPQEADEDDGIELDLDFASEETTEETSGSGEDLDIEELLADANQILPEVDELLDAESERSEEAIFDEVVESQDHEPEPDDEDLTLTFEADLGGEPETSPLGPVDQLPSHYEGSVELAGVTIALASLHKACELVFSERVELITDEELLAEDKIAVVGRRCGIKILHGPSLAIETPEAPSTATGERIRISPVSLQAALAKVFEEDVQLVPDPRLLSEGVISFAGRHCGIVILRNEAAEVPLPPWVDPEMSATIQAASDAMLGQADWATVDVPRLLNEHEGIIAEIEALKSQIGEGGVAMPAPEPADTVEAEAPAPAPEPEVPLQPEPAAAPPEPPPAPEPVVEDTEADEEEIDADIDGLDLDGVLDGAVEEIQEASEAAAADADAAVAEAETGAEEAELDLEGLEDLSLDDLDTDDLEVPELGDLGEEAAEGEAAGGEEDGDGLMADVESLLAESDVDEEEVSKVLNGELVLVLGGEEQNREEYGQVVEQIGGTCEWYASLADMGEGEISELVERADIIMTLADAITDPGILQATDTAQQLNKRCFAHHSSAPASVRGQLVKLVQEGKV